MNTHPFIPADALPQGIEVTKPSGARVSNHAPAQQRAAPKRKRVAPTIMRPLADDVAGLEAKLAQTLGVPTTPQGFKPGDFVNAVHAIHTALEGVRDALDRRQSELDQREMALEARERAVERREELAAATLGLAPYLPPRANVGHSRGILGALRRFWRG